mmetsp:Transcript_10396/g.32278  ORF Transcript_10396/g.32278 Transcript_10396/m.32278 type:complete len:219 (-) Transcript_10396:168-824(-)
MSSYHEVPSESSDPKWSTNALWASATVAAEWRVRAARAPSSSGRSMQDGSSRASSRRTATLQQIHSLAAGVRTTTSCCGSCAAAAESPAASASSWVAPADANSTSGGWSTPRAGSRLGPAASAGTAGSTTAGAGSSSSSRWPERILSHPSAYKFSPSLGWGSSSAGAKVTRFFFLRFFSSFSSGDGAKAASTGTASSISSAHLSSSSSLDSNGKSARW